MIQWIQTRRLSINLCTVGRERADLGEGASDEEGRGVRGGRVHHPIHDVL